MRAVGPRDVEQLVGETAARRRLELVVRGAQPLELLVGGHAVDREVAVLAEERDLLVGDVDLEVGRGLEVRSDMVHPRGLSAWRMELSRTISVGEQTTWRGAPGSPAYGEQLGGRPADLVRGLGNDRELRARERGPRRIVEADDRDVVGDPTAELAQRAQRADRHRLVRDEQRVRRRCRLEQRAGGAIAAVLLEVGAAHERAVDRHAGARERVAVALQPLVRGVDPVAGR